MSLLEPGSHRAADLVSDEALVRAMVRVEVGWLHALADAGLLKREQSTAAEETLLGLLTQLDPEAVEASANPVSPLVQALRASLDEDVAAVLHRGLTSQDVLDTALMLVAHAALEEITSSLKAVASDLARLADTHRDSVMAGRTLTQFAVPVTFGLKAAQWLVGVLDAADAVDVVRDELPIQCGGAAGTLALASDLVPDPAALASGLADQLGLVWPGIPWHTRRTPVTRLGDTLVQVVDALGVIAADILLLGRPEIAEVRERRTPGRGGSSTMPHKQNPVLAVLIRSSALQAPLLAAQLHLCAAEAVDERPDGAWHAEWPALQRLLGMTAVAAAQAAELVPTLDVDAERMADRARAAAAELLAERGFEGAAESGGPTPYLGAEGGDPTTYLGAATAFVDTALTRYRGGNRG